MVKNVKVIRKSGVPKLSMDDLYKFPFIRLDQVFKRPSSERIKSLVVHHKMDTHKWQEKIDTSSVVSDFETRCKNAWKLVPYVVKVTGEPIKFDSSVSHGGLERLLRHLNMILIMMWEDENTSSVDIILSNMRDTAIGHNEIRIYAKDKPSEVKKRNWKYHAKLNKPSKMESKKMYHKKSQTKKSPVKRMTGDIGQLGKNFRKLI